MAAPGAAGATVAALAVRAAGSLASTAASWDIGSDNARSGSNASRDSLARFRRDQKTEWVGDIVG